MGRTNSTEKKIAIREAQIEKLKEELDKLTRGAAPKTAADLNAENRLLYEGDYVFVERGKLSKVEKQGGEDPDRKGTIYVKSHAGRPRRKDLPNCSVAVNQGKYLYIHSWKDVDDFVSEIYEAAESFLGKRDT